jgi:PIN domain nuclease of toxin-antitoxin system
MRLLVDSHALIWYVDQDHLLSAASHAAITDPSNDLLLSAGSIWEIGIKVGLGKLVVSQPINYG